MLGDPLGLLLSFTRLGKGIPVSVEDDPVNVAVQAWAAAVGGAHEHDATKHYPAGSPPGVGEVPPLACSNMATSPRGVWTRGHS